MAKAEWGAKRACQSCGAKYYDMQRSPIVCPKCGTQFDPDALLKSRRVRSSAAKPEAAKPKPKPVKAEVKEEAEDEADAVEDEIEALVEDDDADDDALIEDASELGDEDDVADVVVEDKEKDDT